MTGESVKDRLLFVVERALTPRYVVAINSTREALCCENCTVNEELKKAAFK